MVPEAAGMFPQDRSEPGEEVLHLQFVCPAQPQVWRSYNLSFPLFHLEQPLPALLPSSPHDLF